MQLAAWLPGNTNCDRLQCAGNQISTVMHCFRLTQWYLSTNFTAVGIDTTNTYLSHLTSFVYFLQCQRTCLQFFDIERLLYGT